MKSKTVQFLCGLITRKQVFIFVTVGYIFLFKPPAVIDADYLISPVYAQSDETNHSVDIKGNNNTGVVIHGNDNHVTINPPADKSPSIPSNSHSYGNKEQPKFEVKLNYKLAAYSREPSLHVEISEFNVWPGYGDLSYVADSGNPEKIRYPVFSISPAPSKSIVFLWRKNDGTDVPVKKIDMDNYYKNDLKDKLKLFGDKNITKKECNIYGCAFYELKPILCNPYVKLVKISKDGVNFNDAVDTSSCLTLNNISNNSYNGSQICVPAQELGFEIKPESILYFEITLRDGSKIKTSMQVGGFLDWYQISDYNYFSGVMRGGINRAALNWTKLTSLDILKKSPSLWATYSVGDYTGFSSRDAFLLTLGVSECRDYSAKNWPKFLFDTDGEGFLDRGNGLGIIWFPYQRYRNAQSTNKMTKNINFLNNGINKIGIMLSGINGKNLGPYWYEFNAEKIVLSQRDKNEKPKIDCDTAYKVCIALNVIVFFDVEKVEFSDSQKNWKTVLPIKYDVASYLTHGCNISNIAEECFPFAFKIPEDWERLFSRVTLKNGEIIGPTRHY